MYQETTLDYFEYVVFLYLFSFFYILIVPIKSMSGSATVVLYINFIWYTVLNIWLHFKQFWILIWTRSS